MVTAFAGLVGEHHGPATDVRGVLTPESYAPMTECPAIMSRAAVTDHIISARLSRIILKATGTV